ncbi:transcriptional regulator with XRE-family HTH domain [Streptomyces sp. PvR006]|uniref:helix-turn-helix domain-containing protein n=1 Tax=Streptomyces sp. PvR006 TaxID=2817860 RepID=UPI001AE1CD0C|nr:helix-turn-helix transcriptional regulator [Streptomyces sp. PvR006]MBP2583411.1 transcriptional regulator with XRE-family HTH domain [Streptomyces sp. PvR006]
MTDPGSSQEALGARLRELRAETGLTGKEFAGRLGWQESKVSRLQSGKQKPSAEDLALWAAAAARPDVLEELLARLRAVESQPAHWSRQLAAGHAPVQDRYVVEYRRTTAARGYETSVIPGLVQTADYARHLLTQNAALMRSPRDTEAAVQSRMRRQEVLYDPERLFRVLIWEAALYAHVGTAATMTGQLDRLVGLIGMSTVDLGIVPLRAPMPLTPKHGFWIFDEQRVVVETISTELQYDGSDDVALYTRVWDQLSEHAARGLQAQRLLGRVRASIARA